MRRNSIVATLLVLVLSGGIGFMVGGGPNESQRSPVVRPTATPGATPATPAETPGDLPPFFRIVDDHDHASS